MIDSRNTSRCSCSTNIDSSGKPLIGQIAPKREGHFLLYLQLGAEQNWSLAIRTSNSIL